MNPMPYLKRESCWYVYNVDLKLVKYKIDFTFFTVCFTGFHRGGVYTPGATFAKTTLIDRLNKHGIQFSVL